MYIHYTIYIQVHEELQKCFNMLIPGEGLSKIKDNNCCVFQSQLQTLFFGRPIDVSAILTESGGNTDLLKKYYISEQVQSSKQTVIFPNPFDTHNNKSKSREGKDKKNSNPYSFDNELIIDVPIGMRLLNAYRNIYKDKKMKLWAVPRTSAPADSPAALASTPTGGLNTGLTIKATSLVPSQMYRSGKTAIPTPVPGSADWGKKRMESNTSLNNLAGLNESGVEDDDKLVVNVKALTTNWINMTSVSRSNTQGRPPQAMLSRQSPISVAVHCGLGNLYAVAYNSVSIGTDARLVFVEGVSVLPPGSRWLTLALRCIGTLDLLYYTNSYYFCYHSPYHYYCCLLYVFNMIGKNVSNLNNISVQEDDDDDSDDEYGFGHGGGGGKKKAKVSQKLKKAPKQNPYKVEPSVDRTLTEEDNMKCSKVYELLQRISRGPVMRAPGVISQLEELFIGVYTLLSYKIYIFYTTFITQYI